MENSSPYDILGISSDATPRKIRLAYLLLSLEAHPDRGGSHTKMVAVRSLFNPTLSHDTHWT
jgi:curved DNA-binding protein CbpA